MQNPHDTDQTLTWDQQTLADWMTRNIKFDTAKKIFKIGIESIYACDPSEISLLHTLFYCKSGNDLDMLLNIDKGAQQDRIYGGAQGLADKIADEFRSTIRLSTPVTQAKDLAEIPEAERKATVLDELTKFFGDEARDVILYKDKIWVNEEWSGGCYAAMRGKGGWAKTSDDLSKPIGHIHWAGTETSDRWYKYMKGAVIAGKRAATEVEEFLES